MPRKPSRSPSNAAAAKQLASKPASKAATASKPAGKAATASQDGKTAATAAAGAAKPSVVPPEQMRIKDLCDLLKSKGLPHGQASKPVLLQRLQKAPQTEKFSGFNLPPKPAKTADHFSMPKTVAKQKSAVLTVDAFLAKMAKTATPTIPVNNGGNGDAASLFKDPTLMIFRHDGTVLCNISYQQRKALGIKMKQDFLRQNTEPQQAFPEKEPLTVFSCRGVGGGNWETVLTMRSVLFHIPDNARKDMSKPRDAYDYVRYICAVLESFGVKTKIVHEDDHTKDLAAQDAPKAKLHIHVKYNSKSQELAVTGDTGPLRCECQVKLKEYGMQYKSDAFWQMQPASMASVQEVIAAATNIAFVEVHCVFVE
jgi:hypothetical protein